MKTLKGTVLSTLSYSQTQEFCFRNPTVFDCDWGLWRDKAMADFGISEQFFDLVPQLPGSQRYLQIKSYHVLTPDMAVRVHSDGFIEGVYEAVTGYLKAKSQGMKAFFAGRLKPEQELYLIEEGRLDLIPQPLSGKEANDSKVYVPVAHKTNDREELEPNTNYKPDYRGYIYSYLREVLRRGDGDEAFINLALNADYEDIERYFPQALREGSTHAVLLEIVLSSGRTDWIDQVLQRYFTLPPGFSIEKDIDYIPFWVEEFPLYNLPLYQGSWIEAREILAAAVRGSNVKVIDFFRSIFRDKLQNISDIVRENNKKGLSLQKNPEACLGIHRRFRQVPNIIPFMIEQALDLGDFLNLIRGEPGNIPNLFVSLLYLDREDLQKLERTFRKNYPLSKRMLEEYTTLS
ncbi:Hypothetical protein BQ3484_97 [Cedratvirus A11]|uniref:Uncharacterized protein n=1 Tax=Cedratvirus A11 TaxID=1903266 RepID=A0A1M7XU20_9VIRU|nr:Hypothetical protein BQ3484_97 [Cedratvirus A11]SHO33165.1 Hypothetical protein BQ3484_97 [Cedratvirus A11]